MSDSPSHHHQQQQQQQQQHQQCDERQQKRSQQFISNDDSATKPWLRSTTNTQTSSINQHQSSRSGSLNKETRGMQALKGAVLSADGNALPPSLLPSAITSAFYSSRNSSSSISANSGVANSLNNGQQHSSRRNGGNGGGGGGSDKSDQTTPQNFSGAGNRNYTVHIHNLDLQMNEREWRRVIEDCLAEEAAIYLVIHLFILFNNHGQTNFVSLVFILN